MTQFSYALRLTHWIMAALVLAMLFIGVGMVNTVSEWRLTLFAWHKPLGILIFVLVIVRIVLRAKSAKPKLPADLPKPARFAAKASHLLLYLCLLLMPLFGWATLSAGGFPVTLGAGVSLPPIWSESAPSYAFFRLGHKYLAWAFFVLILGHMTMGLYHGLIRRDGVLQAISLKKH